MRSLLSLLAVVCCCSLPAQLPPGTRTFAPGEIMIPWPADLGTGPIRDLVGVFWHTNDNLSAFGLRGTASGLAVAPGISSGFRPVSLGTIAADVVTLPLAAGVGSTQHDALLFSGLPPVDLGIAFCDANGEPDVTLFTHTGWSRATMLTTRVDGTGIDVIGKAFSGSTLLRTRYEQGVFVQLPDVAIGAVIRDLCFVDYDQDAYGDAAVLTDTELRIVDAAGNTLFTSPLAAPGGAIEPVPQIAQRNSVALLRRKVAPAGWELVHISQAAVEAPQAVTLLVADFVLNGFGSGDFDGDGIWDVAIQDGGNSVRLVKNQGVAPHFANADAVDPLTVGNLGGVQGQASVRDYDHDGCADLLVPLAVGGSNWLVLKKGMRSHVLPVALTYGEMFMELLHETAGDGTLAIRLATDEMGPFKKVVVLGYTVHEDAIPPDGGVSALPEFDARLSVDDLEASGGQITGELDGERIHYRRLLFLHLQLFDDEGVLRPSFVTGGTIDNDGATVPSSGYCEANAIGGAMLQPIKRTPPSGGERFTIGLHVWQQNLPIR
jgi:hypothetical protein